MSYGLVGKAVMAGRASLGVVCLAGVAGQRFVQVWFGMAGVVRHGEVRTAWSGAFGQAGLGKARFEVACCGRQGGPGCGLTGSGRLGRTRLGGAGLGRQAWQGLVWMVGPVVAGRAAAGIGPVRRGLAG